MCQVLPRLEHVIVFCVKQWEGGERNIHFSFPPVQNFWADERVAYLKNLMNPRVVL